MTKEGSVTRQAAAIDQKVWGVGMYRATTRSDAAAEALTHSAAKSSRAHVLLVDTADVFTAHNPWKNPKDLQSAEKELPTLLSKRCPY